MKRIARCFIGALIASLQLLAACGNTVCVDSEFGDWAFTGGQWVHCKSWVAACELSRELTDCTADARDMGCRL